MNGGLVRARVADGLYKLNVPCGFSIEEAFREAPLRFLAEPGESFVANAFGLERLEIAHALLATEIGDRERPVVSRQVPRQYPYGRRAGYDQINAFGDLLVDAFGRAGNRLLGQVLQVVAEDDFDQPPDNREFLLRKRLRNERSRAWPQILGLRTGWNRQEGAFARVR